MVKMVTNLLVPMQRMVNLAEFSRPNLKLSAVQTIVGTLVVDANYGQLAYLQDKCIWLLCNKRKAVYTSGIVRC